MYIHAYIKQGAREATGDVVTFLDAHIEVNDGWAEPLLQRIKEDRRHVVMPIIDSIDPDTFAYRSGVPIFNNRVSLSSSISCIHQNDDGVIQMDL